jgi:hypothetical protein
MCPAGWREGRLPGRAHGRSAIGQAPPREEGTVMELFIVVTLQNAVSGGGVTLTTWAGTLTVKPGATRADVYRHALEHMTPEDARGGNVLFFSAEPMLLGSQA